MKGYAGAIQGFLIRSKVRSTLGVYFVSAWREPGRAVDERISLTAAGSVASVLMSSMRGLSTEPFRRRACRACRMGDLGCPV